MCFSPFNVRITGQLQNLKQSVARLTPFFEQKPPILMDRIVTALQNIDIVSSGFDQIKITSAAVVVWAYLYFLVERGVRLEKLGRKQRNDTKNRLVSIVHGVATFFMAVYCIFVKPHALDSANDTMLNSIVIFSLSYIIYDLVACYYYDLFDFGLLMHHSFCIMGYVSALVSGYGAIESVAGLMYAEISNLPMHLRMISKNFGLRYSKSYEYCENVYLATYILSRGISCPIFLLIPTLFYAENCPYGVRIICLLILLQSAYYISQMAGIIRKKLKQYKEMRQKRVSYNWFSLNENLEKLSFVKIDEKQKIF